MEIVIADNGTGFGANDERSGQHQGLANMRARVQDLDGELLIHSALGTGSRITVRVPAMATSEAAIAAGGGDA
jgi:two-component system, NarL family, sensor histidine kinase DegS